MVKIKKRPPFRLPPYKVNLVVTSCAQTIDWGMTFFGIPSLLEEIDYGEGIRIVVLDTGEPDHPDLAGSTEESKDFTGEGVRDGNGHSTHCAGILGARNNTIGIMGVLPKCKLSYGKVLGDNGSGGIDGIVEGVKWAASLKPDVISMSLGSAANAASMERAMKVAADTGIFFVCASGNEGPGEDTMGHPGRYPFVVGVGAVNKNGELADFSSRGQGMDICGPGVDILSTYTRKRYASLSGTSMATPFIAGTVGMLIAYRRKKNKPPISGYTQLLKLLTETAKDMGPPGFDTGYGYGLVSPKDLVSSNGHVEPPPPPPTEEKWYEWSLPRPSFVPKDMTGVKVYFGKKPGAQRVYGPDFHKHLKKAVARSC